MEELNNYTKYRGKCRQFCEELLQQDSSLTLVRGFYICPIWGKQAHWWLTTTSGEIIDPTVKQFPTHGIGATYEEFLGVCECANCGKEVLEEAAKIESNYSFCSSQCLMRFVGL